MRTRTYRHIFLINDPCRGGVAHNYKNFFDFYSLFSGKIWPSLSYINVAVIQTMMMMITPKTVPMMFRVLAVLDASSAIADSPRVFAFCAFKKKKNLFLSFTFNLLRENMCICVMEKMMRQ